ncbi:hypothetical protein EDB89DRAFT_1995332 [Lactarius sanguifluus]|nr:hypothetical protein EDB89DRAFT_1995332 [Lactarius sanguifluus]
MTVAMNPILVFCSGSGWLQASLTSRLDRGSDSSVAKSRRLCFYHSDALCVPRVLSPRWGHRCTLKSVFYYKHSAVTA